MRSRPSGALGAFQCCCRCDDVQFSAGTKELIVTTLQAAVLMLFNDARTLNVDEIADRLGVRVVIRTPA